ncbi:uncharacterized protein LOC141617397 isoform X1 [Silene latifolia]|uniref:uncharacterized protein LOC141617397 isoform X1 n=1 Tax=Silene latifolia TaxID=37657 RepID=UPI003D774AC7
MKITPSSTTTLLSSKPTPQDLLSKIPLPRRKPSKTTPRLPRKPSAVARGPSTPLLRWDHRQDRESAAINNVDEDKPPELRRKSRRARDGPPLSARKLGAALWRMQAAAAATNEDNIAGGDRLGFKLANGHGIEQLSCHHGSRECGSEAKDPLTSPCSVNGPVNGYLCERQPPILYTNYAMEGATKWDPIGLKPSNENPNDTKLVEQKANPATISALEKELEQARARIEEMEVERRSSKKKVEHFLKKLSEERATWRSREHEKVRAIIEDIKGDFNRERKNRQRLEMVNSKLVNEVAEVKLSAKRYVQDYEKERKSRELIEEVCDELAKEIGEDKAEVDSLKKECMKIREEVEDERRMLQMAEVWREERVQMKLVDAKVALDQKYSQMSYLVDKMEKFLKSQGVKLDANDLREAELFQKATASINIKDIKEFTYEPSNADDIFAVVQEMAMAESDEREIEPCVEYSPASHASKVRTVSPEMNSHNKDHHRLSNIYGYRSGDMDDDGSGWETISHGEDRGSSFSPEGSIMSVNRMYRDSNVSGSCTEWEEQVGDETPITEISEVCSVSSKQLNKVKSISRLWRSNNNSGDGYKTIPVDGIHGRLSNGRVSNGRISNGSTMSPDRGSCKGGISPSNIAGWSSPESGNSHASRGMKGCIEWPRGVQRHSLKNKLVEARMESQKIQLRHVLKQKI